MKWEIKAGIVIVGFWVSILVVFGYLAILMEGELSRNDMDGILWAFFGIQIYGRDIGQGECFCRRRMSKRALFWKYYL